MSGLFDSGPSAGEIQRAETAAFNREADRLRLEEQKLRQRETEETMQGEGISSSGSITIGSDEEQTNTGGTRVQSIDRGPEVEDPWETDKNVISTAIKSMKLTGLGIRL
jgi:hypothetical protein